MQKARVPINLYTESCAEIPFKLYDMEYGYLACVINETSQVLCKQKRTGNAQVGITIFFVVHNTIAAQISNLITVEQKSDNLITVFQLAK